MLARPCVLFLNSPTWSQDLQHKVRMRFGLFAFHAYVQGTDQNLVGCQILLVETNLGISLSREREIKTVISAGRIWNHANTDCKSDFYRQNVLLYFDLYPDIPMYICWGLSAYVCVGAGIAQWLERRTRDWKVAGSNPCWNGGRIFFSRVNFLCWLLFRYPFHPRVTAVARKKSRSFCQKCRWQVTAKHAYTLRMWLLLNRASALVTTCP